MTRRARIGRGRAARIDRASEPATEPAAEPAFTEEEHRIWRTLYTPPGS